MILNKHFNRNLIKAELDTSGEEAILTIGKPDPIIVKKIRDEHATERFKEHTKEPIPLWEYNVKTEKWRALDPYELADRDVQHDIQQAIKSAKEWAKEKTTKKVRTVYAE